MKSKDKGIREITLEELQEEAKNRLEIITQKLSTSNINLSMNKNKAFKENPNSFTEEIRSYNHCSQLIKNSRGIKCKYCGSYNIIPYYYGILYPSIIDSKKISLDQDFKYDGLKKANNIDVYYCKDCKRDFPLF